MARTKTNKGSGYNRHKLHYDSEFKWRVCQEYLNSTDTKIAVQRRNGIKCRTAIVVWLRQFGLKDKVKPLTLSEQFASAQGLRFSRDHEHWFLNEEMII